MVGLLLIHTSLLAYSASRHSPTADEPGHLVAGLSHWRFGRFELYRVNPPMVRMVAALPVLVNGFQEDWSSFRESPGSRPIFALGVDFINVNAEQSAWLFIIARWACIPFSILGATFCFFWSRELWRSNFAGILSISFWCFEPTMLAHSELITNDCAATSFAVASGYFFWKWLCKPNWIFTCGAGISLGLALLTKMTCLIFLVLWPLLTSICIYLYSKRMHADQKVASRPEYCGKFVLVLMIALYLLNMGYSFDGTLTRLGEFNFVSKTLNGSNKAYFVGNRFRRSVFENLPIPFPKQFVIGLDTQKRDFEEFQAPSYLRGEWRQGGWWYYYIYGLFVKTTPGAIFLACIVPVVAFQKHFSYKSIGYESQIGILILISSFLSILFLASSQLEFNHHFRYILPCYGLIFVGLGCVVHLQMAQCLKKLLIIAVTCSCVFSMVSVYPHQLTYYNQFVGGPIRGRFHMLGSNYDWGQNLLLLKEWQIANYIDEPIFLAHNNTYSPSDFGIKNVVSVDSDGTIHGRIGKSIPKWIIISGNFLVQGRLKSSTWGEKSPNRIPIENYLHTKPECVLGNTLFVFRYSQ